MHAAGVCPFFLRSEKKSTWIFCVLKQLFIHHCYLSVFEEGIACVLLFCFFDFSFVAFYCLDTAVLFMSESILGAKIILELSWFLKKTSLQKFEGIGAEHFWTFVPRVCLTEASRVLYSQSAFFPLNILPLWSSPKTKTQRTNKKVDTHIYFKTYMQMFAEFFHKKTYFCHFKGLWRVLSLP